MYQIYLLRHGETAWNVERRLQGQQDSPLTQRGREQAINNGHKLSELLKPGTCRLVSSPLGRCRQTAELVAACLGYDSSRLEVDGRLREIGFGRWEGKTKQEIKAVERELYYRRNSDRWNIPAPGGESYSDVAVRLNTWLAALGDETIVAVSHGGTGRILRGLHCNLNPEEIANLSEPHDSIFLLEGEGLINEIKVQNVHSPGRL